MIYLKQTGEKFSDIYSARETDTLGVSAALIAEMIGDKALYCPSFQDTADAIYAEAGENDVVIVMGAGDIYKVFGCLGDRLDSDGGVK